MKKYICIYLARLYFYEVSAKPALVPSALKKESMCKIYVFYTEIVKRYAIQSKKIKFIVHSVR